MASYVEEAMDCGRLGIMGPAQTHFSNLSARARDFLDEYFHHWNDNRHPKSYILPIVFRFKNAEMSDEACESHRGTTSDNIILDSIQKRDGDEGEHMVYQAISELITGNSGAPFLAIHSLNTLHFFNKIRNILGKTDPWPDSFHEKLREHDFIIIGPKIGIVSIEVKSQSFDNHFNMGNALLPKDYAKGIDQAESVDGLLEVLEDCTDNKFERPSKEMIRKIIFTPNLSKARYNQWFDSLTKEDQSKVMERIGHVEQWFQEDTLNPGYENVPLHFKLKTLLDNPREISLQLYEGYVEFLAAISSSVFLRLKGFPHLVPILEELNFSKYRAAMATAKLIQDQNPKSEPKCKRSKTDDVNAASGSILKRASETSLHQDTKPPKSMVIFLSPDQQAALLGPVRQFILGAAGTGKSIVLQSMALQVLDRNQSIAIISSDMYADRYRSLLEEHKFTNYKILPASTPCTDFGGLYRTMIDHLKSSCKCSMPCNCALAYILECIEKEEDTPWQLEELLSFDNIIIDDAFDLNYLIGYNSSDERSVRMSRIGMYPCFLFPFLLMVFGRRKSVAKRIWVGLDPHIKWFGTNRAKTTSPCLAFIVSCVARRPFFKPATNGTRNYFGDKRTSFWVIR